jgi:hypothetical protein
VEKKKISQPLKATPDMLNLLWAAKDRSSSLHKSLRTLQLLFEDMVLTEVDEGTRKAMTFAFLKSIDNLKYENLDELQSHFSEFLDKYPANFEQFCKQTKGRSNWRCWYGIRPALSPGYITKTIEGDRESAQRWKELLDKLDTSKLKPPSLSETLGDIARIIANEVDMFEDTVDDLFSIGLFGKWDDMREEFARMSEERCNELKTAVKKELNAINKELEQNLKDERFQIAVLSTKVFTNYERELKQHLCLNDFLMLQDTYSKITALAIPSNLAGVNKKKYKEAMVSIEEAKKMLDKKDLWNDIKATKSLM